jgi:endonuclease/exonuclease/phosphatase family metal-dependent hydrolase
VTRHRLLVLTCVLVFVVGLPLSLPGPPGSTPASAARTGPLLGPAGGDELHVMTFNLRFAKEGDTYSWSRRRPVMAELLRREQPTLLGTQEGLYGQLRDIAEDLPVHYDWIGEGRKGGSRDEFMAVFFDTRRLEPVAYDHFWLSDTPEAIGSNTWGGGCPRMVTWVRFRDLLTGGELYAVNTHLDHASQHARERAAALIAERLRALDPGPPRVVTGDFNVPAHGNPVHDLLLEEGGLADTWDTAEERGEQYATFHGYGPLVPGGDRIDWILASPGVTVHEASANTFAEGGQYPTDHLPVEAVLGF